MAERGMLKVPIKDHWHYKEKKESGDGDSYPVSQFPTNIHLDLLADKKIPDPHIGQNELDIQWVGETSWEYFTHFECPHITAPVKPVLVFDGLDTFATVYLNGHEILNSDNMFLSHRVDVSGSVNVGGANHLRIIFESAFLRGKKRIVVHKDHKYICSNGDESRLAVRKAQYHWGWDWGPTYITCGPWRPVTLELYESRISDLWADVHFDRTLENAVVTVNATIEGSASKIRLELGERSSEKVVGSSELDIKDPTHIQQAVFKIHRPRLWWPAHVGERTQSLYTLTATILNAEVGLHSISKNIGLRKVELVQEPLLYESGQSFFFKINNCPIFCGGSNWIPADNFIPRITDEKYYDWVKSAVDGMQNMIRVWGGGIYEQDAFYDACDDLGILVWQDFMFACGNYPCWPEFLNSVDLEARENVKLLRHHPSIVIWAGNNEDYQIAEEEGLTYDPNDKDPESWLKTDFPARYIYEKILADACKELIPQIPYHFGSPWGGKSAADPTVGDIHQWNVWHGTQERYQDWGKLVGRFVSEFGMQAFPDIRTIAAFLPDGRSDKDAYPQSATLDFHNKATGHERRLALYLVENMRYSFGPLEYYIYCTQLMQADCLSTAYRLWKRQWKGDYERNCGGALVWQLNDVWPGTSWSIRDYYGRNKLAYYAIKREMAELSVGVIRCDLPGDERFQHETTLDPEEPAKTLEVWACNLNTADAASVKILILAWDLAHCQRIIHKPLDVELLPNRTTEIKTPPISWSKAEDRNIIVAVYLFNKNRRLLARCVDWPQPLKYVHMKDPKNRVGIGMSNDLKSVGVTSEVPIKGVVLKSDDPGVEFGDYGFDVLPHDPMNVPVSGATKETTISIEYCYQGW